MRLLLTTDTVGGVWTFTSGFSEELLRQGHDVQLVSFGGRPSASQQRRCEELSGQYPERFSYVASDVALEWMPDNVHAFSAGQAVLQERLASTHAELLLSSQLCFGAMITEVPRVVVAHSDVFSWAAACDRVLEPSAWLTCYRALVENGLRGADAVIAPTRWMLEALTCTFELPRRASVVPNGASVTPAIDSPPRQLQAVSAGRLWDEGKGLETLLATTLPCPVLIAGALAGPGETGSPSLPQGIQALGALPTEGLHEVFRRSAMYLCTSRYEPFGLAPVEAALCGCAVIAREIPSLREVWGDAALYFKDAQDLRDQVRRLTEDAEALQEAQAMAQRRARTYTVERMVTAYLGVFDCLQSARRSATYAA